MRTAKKLVLKLIKNLVKGENKKATFLSSKNLVFVIAK